MRRVLIVDWDVHHGNGTNEIFHADPDVPFASIHQSPFYPGTGAAARRGEGEGPGLTVNLPVPAGAGDALWCSLVEHVVGAAGGGRTRPQLVLVSAGYDAHADDPLAQCEVTDGGYAAMTRSLRRWRRGARRAGRVRARGRLRPRGAGPSVVATLAALQEPLPAGDADGSADAAAPVVGAARERLSEWWPALC